MANDGSCMREHLRLRHNGSRGGVLRSGRATSVRGDQGDAPGAPSGSGSGSATKVASLLRAEPTLLLTTT